MHHRQTPDSWCADVHPAPARVPVCDAPATDGMFMPPHLRVADRESHLTDAIEELHAPLRADLGSARSIGI